MKTIHTHPFFTTGSLLLLLSLFNSSNLWAETSSDRFNSNRLPQSDSPAFSIHDTDKNGSLNREEYRRFVSQIERRRKSSQIPASRYSTLLKFEEIDANADGHITEDELLDTLNRHLRQHRRYRYRGGRGEPSNLSPE